MSLTTPGLTYRLVVGYSGSLRGEHALQHAARLVANRAEAGLIVTYITSPARVALLSGGIPAAVGPLLRQEAAIATRVAARAESLLSGYMVEWQFVHKYGNVAAVLCSVADEAKSAGIVVGRPRALWQRFGGSVPARLARSANHKIFVA
jgi:nucleotide-binding universal stress UspA family protein